MTLGDYLNELDKRESLKKLYLAGLLDSKFIEMKDFYNYFNALEDKKGTITAKRECIRAFKMNKSKVSRWLQRLKQTV